MSMLSRVCFLTILAAALFFSATAAAIVVDGVNDFPPTALVDTDGGDTELPPIDLGNIYMTWDSQKLYIGYEHDHGTWTGVQVGIAIVSFAGQGGSWDPWDRRIDFIGMCVPDFVAYKNIDNDYDDLVKWDAVNLDWILGTYDLNWVVGTGFDELEIPFDAIGIDCLAFNQIFIEMWVTQSDCNKGPLDLSFNDDLQLSNPAGTTWELPCDGSKDVEISCYHCLEMAYPSETDPDSWSRVKSLWR